MNENQLFCYALLKCLLPCALRGSLPSIGVFVGTTMMQRNCTFTNSRCICKEDLPPDFHYFEMNGCPSSPGICFVHKDNIQPILTGGMNGCSISIYKINDYYMFFHNKNNIQIENPEHFNSFKQFVIKEAKQKGIISPDTVDLSLEPIDTITERHYSRNMKDDFARIVDGAPVSCSFMPVIMPKGNMSQLCIFFFFFEEHIPAIGCKNYKYIVEESCLINKSFS